MEITLQSIIDRRAQIMAELEQLIAQVNFLRGSLAELQKAEDFLKTEVVDQPAPIHAVEG